MRNVAVLASGGGTNLEAIFNYASVQREESSFRVVLVASDRVNAGALERARKRGVAAEHIERHADGNSLNELLARYRTDLLVLAGYLRLVPPEVVTYYSRAILNIHPALLPQFGGKGMHGQAVHAAVLRSGVRITGATVHYVDVDYDTGPIVAQWPVPVRLDDTVDSIAARVLQVEHALLPRVVDAVARGNIAWGAQRNAYGTDSQAGWQFIYGHADTLGAAISCELGIA